MVRMEAADHEPLPYVRPKMARLLGITRFVQTDPAATYLIDGDHEHAAALTRDMLKTAAQPRLLRARPQRPEC
jgi:hypothetical protein